MSLEARLRKLEKLKGDKYTGPTSIIFQEIQPDRTIASTALRLDFLTGKHTEIELTPDELAAANEKLAKQFEGKDS